MGFIMGFFDRSAGIESPAIHIPVQLLGQEDPPEKA